MILGDARKCSQGQFREQVEFNTYVGDSSFVAAAADCYVERST